MSHPLEYHAEVTAEGFVYGGERRARVVLGEFRAHFIRPAVAWLNAKALMIANRLDPHPRSSWCPPQALQVIPDSVGAQLGDVPAQLRAWAVCRDERRQVIERLREGDPFALIVSDHSGVYAFTLWPVTVAATPPPSPPGRARHRKRRGSHLLERQPAPH
ncbi:hypothetical protein [Streptomyces uncialis]|uniref:hypothetical protein n=1 Tax=Streptomyces uncialis TaxID=1048205 RepID=UPI00386F5C0A|nr:hypothetical protein OG268_16620 [Streptomyces uncialis]